MKKRQEMGHRGRDVVEVQQLRRLVAASYRSFYHTIEFKARCQNAGHVGEITSLDHGLFSQDDKSVVLNMFEISVKIVFYSLRPFLIWLKKMRRCCFCQRQKHTFCSFIMSSIIDFTTVFLSQCYPLGGKVALSEWTFPLFCRPVLKMLAGLLTQMRGLSLKAFTTVATLCHGFACSRSEFGIFSMTF